MKNFTKGNAQTIIIIVLALVVVLGAGWYFMKGKNSLEKSAMNNDSNNSVVPQANTKDTDTTTYKTYKIDNINQTFKIKEFPNTDFTLSSVVKIDVATPPKGCNSFPKEITDQISIIGNICFDLSGFDPNTNYSLVGVTLKVSNNGNDLVQGDLIKLGYLTETNIQNLRYADKVMDFSSFSVLANQDRTIQLSFWVPTEENELYFIYGMNQLAPGSHFHDSTDVFIREGAKKIDLTSSTVTPNVLILQNLNN